jgi:hypothetical protein
MPAKKKKAVRKNPGWRKGGFARCVKAVTKRGGAYSPGGVCAAQERRIQAKAKRLAAARGRKKHRSNPADEELAERYEFFHGHPPEEVFTFKVPEFKETETWGLGKLKTMTIASVAGGKVVTIGFDKSLLSANKTRTQIFVKGGDQSVNLRAFDIDRAHGLEVLGALMEVGYLTNKTHLTPETGGKAVYDHEFGKGGKRLPMVVYDVRNKLLHVVGGEYTLPATGIKG